MAYDIGIDLGGTNMKAVAMDQDGTIKLQHKIPTEAEKGREHVISRIAESVLEMKDSLDARIATVGVTVPGVVETEKGIVILLPNFPHQWKGINLKEEIEKRIELPVHLLNDARAATYGEKKYGAARAFDSFFYLTIGTGIGGGIVHDGELILGKKGAAGELGHQVIEPNGRLCGCGNRGCLETVASGSAITTAAIGFIKQGIPTLMRDMTEGDLTKVTPELITSAALQGDRSALFVLDQAATHICIVIRNMIASMNPEAVVIGGGVSNSSLLLDMIREKIDEKEILFPDSIGRIEIRKADFNDYGGAIGVAAWAGHQQRKSSIYRDVHLT
ncbi:ROK family protein [Pseudalkalibacillus sp. R45]|uniref:ROK family protein n=1 Tax=Pseudalkalibacillus sp. R45 TaxID=3457433 RepID=UPI003FCC5AA5